MFRYIPDVPVEETWIFLTDILKNHKGVEQRIALRRFPRIQQNITYGVITQKQRRQMYRELFSGMTANTDLPMYQYATHLTTTTTSGNARIYFDVAKTNIRQGQGIAIVDTANDRLIESTVNAIETDGATLDDNVPVTVDTSWVVMPSLKCIIQDESSFNVRSITAEFKVKGESVEDYALVRPGSSTSFTTLDSLKVVTHKHLISSIEDFTYGRDIIDNSTGILSVDYQENRPKIVGNRKFLIQTDSDMDWWRDFFDDIRGAQKPFLLSTQMKDLTFFGTYSSPTSTLQVSEIEYTTEFFPWNSFKYLELEYADGSISRHKVNAATQDGVKSTLTLSSNFTGEPSRISFLNKVRAGDRVVLRHYGRYAEIVFPISTEDE